MKISRGTPAGIGVAVIIAALVFGLFYLIHHSTRPYPWEDAASPAPASHSR